MNIPRNAEKCLLVYSLLNGTIPSWGKENNYKIFELLFDWSEDEYKNNISILVEHALIEKEL